MSERVDIREYSDIGLIGSGAFGEVHLLENRRTGHKLALKLCELPEPSGQSLTSPEVQLLAVLKHENILRFVMTIKYQGKLGIVTEHCQNGDMQTFIEKNGGEAIGMCFKLELIRQIAEALKYLHGLPTPVIHRDLKPANILLDENWNVKVGDFGISRTVSSLYLMAMTQCGTPQYTSPEIRFGLPYSYKTDIYSLGVTMHELIHMDKPAIYRQCNLCIMLWNLHQAEIQELQQVIQQRIPQVIQWIPQVFQQLFRQVIQWIPQLIKWIPQEFQEEIQRLQQEIQRLQQEIQRLQQEIQRFPQKIPLVILPLPQLSPTPTDGVMMSMMKTNPAARPSAAEILNLPIFQPITNPADKQPWANLMPLEKCNRVHIWDTLLGTIQTIVVGSHVM